MNEENILSGSGDWNLRSVEHLNITTLGLYIFFHILQVYKAGVVAPEEIPVAEKILKLLKVFRDQDLSSSREILLFSLNIYLYVE